MFKSIVNSLHNITEDLKVNFPLKKFYLVECQLNVELKKKYQSSLFKPSDINIDFI